SYVSDNLDRTSSPNDAISEMKDMTARSYIESFIYLASNLPRSDQILVKAHILIALIEKNLYSRTHGFYLEGETFEIGRTFGCLDSSNCMTNCG
ncbi:18038_t:CDS:2, partial [Rhizophagus irregularis]